MDVPLGGDASLEGRGAETAGSINFERVQGL